MPFNFSIQLRMRNVLCERKMWLNSMNYSENVVMAVHISVQTQYSDGGRATIEWQHSESRTESFRYEQFAVVFCSFESRSLYLVKWKTERSVRNISRLLMTSNSSMAHPER